MTTTWITRVDVTPSTGSFLDVDVTANVSANATGVILQVDLGGTSQRTFGLRMNGSTDVSFTNCLDDNHVGCWYVGIDADDIFECYVGAGDITVYLVGYYTDEAFFLTNASTKALGGTGTWTNVDISGDLDGADVSYAAMGYMGRSPNESTYGVRADGSTDGRTGTLDRFTGFFVKTVSDIFEYYVSNTGNILYLTGYIRDDTNIVLGTNLTDVSPGTKDSFQDITQAGSTGQFFEFDGNNISFGIRQDGEAGYTTTGHPGGQGAAYPGIGGGATVEVHCGTGGTVHRIGYTTAAAGAAENTISFDLGINDILANFGEFPRAQTFDIGLNDTKATTGIFNHAIVFGLGLRDTLASLAARLFENVVVFATGFADSKTIDSILNAASIFAVGLRDTFSPSTVADRTITFAIGFRDTLASQIRGVFENTVSFGIGFADTLSETFRRRWELTVRALTGWTKPSESTDPWNRTERADQTWRKPDNSK